MVPVTMNSKGGKMDSKKILYRLNDRISFRKCSLWGENKLSYGDCTNFYTAEVNWTTYYCCNQEGLHFHCSKHPEIELIRQMDGTGCIYYKCKRCSVNELIEIDNERAMISECLQLLNIPEFKNAKLVRLDDWYVHEISEKQKTESGYWITTDVKTDKDGDTIIVVYVGRKDTDEKSQFFIKPEKGQLTSDHHDMDPARILSKIEVTFKGRQLCQEYEDDIS